MEDVSPLDYQLDSAGSAEPPINNILSPLLRESLGSVRSSAGNLPVRIQRRDTVPGDGVQAGSDQASSGASSQLATRAVPQEPGLAEVAADFESEAHVLAPSLAAFKKGAVPVTDGRNFQTWHAVLLQGVFFTWHFDAASLPDRVRLAAWLQQYLGVDDALHAAAITQALQANAHYSGCLLRMARDLERAFGMPPGEVPTGICTTLQRHAFMDPTAGFEEWVCRERAALRLSLAQQAHHPTYTGFVKVTVGSVRGDQTQMTHGLLHRLRCCFAPSRNFVAPHVRAWVSHGNAEAGKQFVCTQSAVEADSGGFEQNVLCWGEELPALMVGDPGALLCLELRDRNLMSRAGSSSRWHRIGAVAMALQSFEGAGPGKHKCTAALLAVPSDANSLSDTEAFASRVIHSPHGLDPHQPVDGTLQEVHGVQPLEDTVPRLSGLPAASAFDVYKPGSFGEHSPVSAHIAAVSTPEQRQQHRGPAMGVSGPSGHGYEAVPSKGKAKIVGRITFEFEYIVDIRKPVHSTASPASAPRLAPMSAVEEGERRSVSIHNTEDSASDEEVSPPPQISKPRVQIAQQRMSFRRMLMPPRRRVALSERSGRGRERMTPDEAADLLWAASFALWARPRQHVDRTVSTLPAACIPPDESTASAGCQAYNGFPFLALAPPTSGAVGPSDAGARPPRPVLHALQAMACQLRVRVHEQRAITLLLLAQTLDSTQPGFSQRLRMLEVILEPLAAAAAAGKLTSREVAALMRASGCLLHAAGVAFEGVYSMAEEVSRGLTALLRIVGLCLRYSPDVRAITELVEPHFRTAVRAHLAVHAGSVARATGPYESVPEVVHLLQSMLRDLPKDVQLAEQFPAALGFLNMAAGMRYRMIIATVEQAWSGARKQSGSAAVPAATSLPHTRPLASVVQGALMASDGEAGSLVYDDLLHQFEDLFGAVHDKLIELGVAEPDVQEGAGQSLPAIGSVHLLPGKGLHLLDVDSLLAPQIEAWLRVVSVHLERFAAQAVEREQKAPAARRWAPVSTDTTQCFSQSVVDLSQCLDSTLPKVAARAFARCSRPHAIRRTHLMLEAAGAMYRQYASMLECASLQELAPAAHAAIGSSALSASTKALFVDLSATEVPIQAGTSLHTQSSGPGLDKALDELQATASRASMTSFASAGGPMRSLASTFARAAQALSLSSQSEAMQGLSVTEWPLMATPALVVQLNDLAQARERMSSVGDVLANQLRERGLVHSSNDVRQVSTEEHFVGKDDRVAQSPQPGLQLGEVEQTGGELSAAKSGDDLSFMSMDDCLSSSQNGLVTCAERLRVGTLGMDLAAESLPAAIQAGLDEAVSQIRSCQQTVFTAIHGLFAAVVTAELASILRDSAAATDTATGQQDDTCAGLQPGTLRRSQSWGHSGDSDHVPVPKPPFGEHPPPPGASHKQTNHSTISERLRQTLTWRGQGLGSGGTEKEAIRIVDLDAPGATPSSLGTVAASDNWAHVSSAGLERLLQYVNRIFQVFQEHARPDILRQVQMTMWRALLDVMESALLNTMPGQLPALAPSQAHYLRSMLQALREFFYAEGVGPSLAALDAASVNVRQLVQYFLAPVALLESEYNRLCGQLESAQSRVQGLGTHAAACSASMQQGAARGGQVTMMQLLQLLRQRAADPQTAGLMITALRHASRHAVQVLFGLPYDERVIVEEPCVLAHLAAPGRLVLTTNHLCFTTISSPLAPPKPPIPALSFAYPLGRVASMSKDFVGRTRALAFTFRDRSQLVFSDFPAAAGGTQAGKGSGRDEFEESVRLHVMGTDTLLDRQLRGIAIATAPAALRLPPGEHIVRSFDCALHAVALHNRCGVLYVCRKILLFVSGDTRLLVPLNFIERVELSRGMWRGGHSVVLLCSRPPHKVEFCEMTVAKGEAMAAEILNAIKVCSGPQ